MYRLATLLALLAVLVAGCGDEGSDSGDEASKPAASAVAGASKQKEAADDTKAKPERRKAEAKKDEPEAEEEGEDHEDDSEAASADDPHGHEALEEALEELPSAKRAKLLRTAARVALLHFNLKLADIEVSDGGHTINVLVTRASACNAVAKDEANMVVLIQEAAPIVKRATFEVAGTDQELGYYVLSCKREKMPDGPGRVVFERTAVGGPYTSPRFTIKGKRWALEYENAGSSMAVIVLAV